MRPTHHNDRRADLHHDHGPRDHHDRSPAINVRFHHDNDGREYDVDDLVARLDCGVGDDDRRSALVAIRSAIDAELGAAVSGVVDEQRDVPRCDCLERLRDALDAGPYGHFPDTNIRNALDVAIDGLPDGG